MSDKQLLHNLYRFVLLACLFPPFVGATLMGVIGVYPLPEIFYVFPDVGGLFVFCTTSVILMLVRPAHQFIVLIPSQSIEQQSRVAQRLFRPLPMYIALFISIYIVGGAVSANYSLERQGYVEFELAEYLLTFAGLIPVVLVSVLPIFFYLVDFLGRYLAPRGVNIVSIPMSSKLMMLGLVTPALIDTILIGYFYNRTGYVSFETLILWATLLLIAGVGAFLVLVSFRQGLEPLEKFLTSSTVDDMPLHNLMPQSLDELGSLTDKLNQLLTRQRQLSNDLSEERNFINTVIDTAAALVLVLDREGKICRFNRACEEISQRKFSEVEGKYPWDLFLLPEEAEVVRRNAFDALANNPKKLTGKYSNYWVARDGRRYFIEWSNSLLLDSNGDMAYMVSVGSDITRRIKAEKELAEYRERLEVLVDERTNALRQAQDELIRKERLAALGQLTATVSHELRNPLGAIKPSLYIVSKLGNTGDPKFKVALERIQRNITRCDHIIDELLDFTRITKLELMQTDIEKFLGDILDEQLFPENLRVERQFGLHSETVNIDSSRLRRVIINVIENAVHAMQEGERRAEPKLKVITRKRDSRIEICVIDNGCGIPPELLEKIFEPLFSTKGFGVGLGMAVVKQIMQQHKGGVDIHSEPGKGTEVILWLPASTSEDDTT